MQMISLQMDEMLNEVIKKDSEIQERLYQFESIVQEVEMSKFRVIFQN